MIEEWRPVVGYEELYEVSNTGKVRGLKSKKILRDADNGKGYKKVILYKNYSQKTKYLHRLVAEAYIQNIEGYSSVNHIDENKSNNNVTNLEWCDAKYNDNYGTRNERVIDTKIKKGLIRGYLCGLDKKERNKLYMREYRKTDKWKKYSKEYYKKKV